MVETASGRGQILSPSSDEQILREAEILALRSISDSLASLANEMGQHREAMAKMREEMAVIGERQKQHMEFRDSMREMARDFKESMEKAAQEFKQTMEAMGERVDALEDRNLKQDGAVTFVTLLKDFGPWIVAAAAFIWAFIRR